MNKFDIQKLRELPIESVATRLGLKVEKHKSLCPFHEDSHPSLNYRTSANTFRCFVCGAHGGVIDLALKLLPSKGRSGGVPFVETCEWLANEHNVILTEWKPAEKPVDQKTFDASKYNRYFERPYINEAASRFLYSERHLDLRVIRWCKLNSYRDKNGINWLQIPYFDTEGTLVGVQSRNLDYGIQLGTLKPETWNPRFRFPKSSTCHIYNLPVLKMLKPNEPLYISEGCSDCWSHLSSGHKCVAIPSATLLKPEDLLPLKGRTLHIYPDNDKAGDYLYHQLLSFATPLGCCVIKHQLPEGCKDYSDFYLQQTHKP